jgi:hypothetical protein
MLDQGYLTLRGRGVALRLHWSIPVAGLVLTWFRLSVGAWIGFLFILGVHMLGHAAMAAACGARLSRIDVHGLGGHCGVVGLSARRRMLVASGGILAQLALAALVVLVLRPVADTPFETDLLDMFVGPSLLLAGLNVLPIAPLDGASFWKVPRTVADMEDDGEPESFDNPRPQRANPNPPRRDWFARVRSRSARARAAADAEKLEDDDVAEPELSPEAQDSVDRLFKKMKDTLGE